MSTHPTCCFKERMLLNMSGKSMLHTFHTIQPHVQMGALVLLKDASQQMRPVKQHAAGSGSVVYKPNRPSAWPHTPIPQCLQQLSCRSATFCLAACATEVQPLN